MKDKFKNLLGVLPQLEELSLIHYTVKDVQDEEYGQTDEQVREEDPQGKVVTGVRFSNLKELAFKECNIDALNFDRIISQAPELRSCFSSGSIKSNLQASEIVKALRRVAPTLEYLQISTPTRLRASHPALTFTKPIIPMPSLKEMVSLRKLSLAACVLKLLACPHSHVSFLSACISKIEVVKLHQHHPPPLAHETEFSLPHK